MSENNVKKILVVDDSALMRRVLCDIINSDKRFQVVAKASDGLEALELLQKNSFDAVVLDVNMPRMGGLELLQKIRDLRLSVRVMMASTDTKEGAKTTLDALELGAIDFIHKPDHSFDCREEEFVTKMLNTLYTVSCGQPQAMKIPDVKSKAEDERFLKMIGKHATPNNGEKIVAIASSTGGPRALQEVIPRLPEKLNAPVVVVQHMPKGFTESLAARLNSLSQLEVKEATEGEEIHSGVVYISKGGAHLWLQDDSRGKTIVHYRDDAPREGVKPCANYMYESLMETHHKDIVCAVLTGMGADGTEGIRNLKQKKNAYVIAQNQETCVVYGMPRNVVNAALADKEMGLSLIAQEITMNVGVSG